MLLNVSAGNLAQALDDYLRKCGKVKPHQTFELAEMNPGDVEKVFVVYIKNR